MNFKKRNNVPRFSNQNFWSESRRFAFPGKRGIVFSFLRHRLVICLAVFSLLNIPLLLVPKATGQEISVEEISSKSQKVVLDNGLTVLLREMPDSPMVSVYALIKAGSATEGRLLGSGLTHFMEHMLFKGTPSRDVGVAAREIQAMGGTINASTGYDYTIFTITVPAEKFPQALDILSDMLMHPKFDAAELEKEREVVCREIKLYHDRPQNRLSQHTARTVYHRHPYRVPIIGFEELLRGVAREEFLDYYKTFYVPNNMILSVAGGVAADKVLPQVKEVFKEFQRGYEIVRNLPEEPEQIQPRFYEEEYPTELTRMEISFPGTTISHPDLFALDVVAMILGQGESSRLYQSLAHAGRLVYEISAYNFTPVDKGVFQISSVLDASHIEKTVDAVTQEIGRIKRHGVSAEELDKAKRQVLSEYIHEQQTSSAIAGSMAVDEAFMGDPDFAQNYVHGIREVTRADIRRAAQKYLSGKRMSTVIVRPPAKTQAPARGKAARALTEDFEKIVLDNGMKVLLKEDHRFPLVSMDLVLPGGTGQESAATNGVSNLTARLWLSGTARYTAQELVREIESHGMSASGFSGRNSFGVQMSLLAQDTDYALGLLAEIVRNPVFPSDEFEKEQSRVLAQIQAQEDDIFSVGAKHLRQNLFEKHPMRLDPLGTAESVRKLSREDIVGFYRTYAAAGNMVLTVVGDFSKEKVMAGIKKYFAGLPPVSVEITKQHEAPPSVKEVTISLPKEQAAVLIGFHGVDMYHPDRYGLDILATVLGSSFQGRMFDRIRGELGQAYSLGGQSVPARDAGLIYFYVLTTDENAAKVRDIIFELIDEIQVNGISEKELDNAKSYMKGNFARAVETASGLGFIAGLDESHGLGYDWYKSYDKHVEKTTLEDVMYLARKYLKRENSVTVLIRPAQAPDR